MAGDLKDIYQMLGSLTAEVKNLRQDISEVNAKIEKRLDSLYPKINDLQRRTENVENGFENLQETLSSDVMPVVNEVKAWKQRGIGALAMCGMAGGALGVTISSWWGTLWNHLFRG